jgi:hypothetical protein
MFAERAVRRFDGSGCYSPNPTNLLVLIENALAKQNLAVSIFVICIVTEDPPPRLRRLKDWMASTNSIKPSEPFSA